MLKKIITLTAVLATLVSLTIITPAITVSGELDENYVFAPLKGEAGWSSSDNSKFTQTSTDVTTSASGHNTYYINSSYDYVKYTPPADALKSGYKYKVYIYNVIWRTDNNIYLSNGDYLYYAVNSTPVGTHPGASAYNNVRIPHNASSTGTQTVFPGTTADVEGTVVPSGQNYFHCVGEYTMKGGGTDYVIVGRATNTSNIRIGGVKFTEVGSDESANANGDLSALTVAGGGGALSPAFAASTYSYSITPNENTVQFSATPWVAQSTIAWYYNDTVAGTGNTSDEITIPATDAARVVKAVVTPPIPGENNENVKTYAINIAVPKKSDINGLLAEVSGTDGALSPAFNRNTFTYNFTSNGQTAAFTANPENPAATVTFSGLSTVNGTGAQTTGDIALPANGGTLTITVTPPVSGDNNENVRVYTVNIAAPPIPAIYIHTNDTRYSDGPSAGWTDVTGNTLFNYDGSNDNMRASGAVDNNYTAAVYTLSGIPAGYYTVSVWLAGPATGYPAQGLNININSDGYLRNVPASQDSVLYNTSNGNKAQKWFALDTVYLDGSGTETVSIGKFEGDSAKVNNYSSQIRLGSLKLEKSYPPRGFFTGNEIDADNMIKSGLADYSGKTIYAAYEYAADTAAPKLYAALYKNNVLENIWLADPVTEDGNFKFLKQINLPEFTDDEYKLKMFVFDGNLKPYTTVNTVE